MKNQSAKQYARLRDEQFSLFENYARQNGLNSKCLLVFMWIYNNPKGLTQEYIGKRTYSSKQVIQSIVKNYIEKEWLYLEVTPDDKRKKLVKMTKLGEKELALLIEPLNDYEAQAMSALTSEQQQVLLEGTQVFSKHLRDLLESHQVTRDAK